MQSLVQVCSSHHRLQIPCHPRNSEITRGSALSPATDSHAYQGAVATDDHSLCRRVWTLICVGELPKSLKIPFVASILAWFPSITTQPFPQEQP